MILSFELPFALVPLLKFSSSNAKMGPHKNSIYVSSQHCFVLFFFTIKPILFPLLLTAQLMLDYCGLMGPWLVRDWDQRLLLEHELRYLDHPQQPPETCDGLNWGRRLPCNGVLRDVFDLLDVQEGHGGDLRREVGGFDGAGRAWSGRGRWGGALQRGPCSRPFDAVKVQGWLCKKEGPALM